MAQRTDDEGRSRRGTGSWRTARWARRAVQAITFATFVYLLFGALQRLEPEPYANIFFRFDPLAALTTMLAARAWLAPFALAFITVGLTLVLGRVWCGWICPLGTLLGWLRFPAAGRRSGSVAPALRRVKYVLLGVIVVLAALTNLTLMVLDPLSLLTRTMTASVIPGFVYLVDALERAGITWGPTVGVVQWVESTFRGPVLPTIQPRYEQGVALFLLLLAVVLLSAFADRFWCRYLCPLGALLGLVSQGPGAAPGHERRLRRLRRLRHRLPRRCDRGRRPERRRERRGAGSRRDLRVHDVPRLPRRLPDGERHDTGTRPPGPWAEYDPGRREAVLAVAAGVGTALLLGTGVARAVKRPGLIRPPGAQDEGRFLARCLRCSECMKACPTSGLQPTLAEAGLEGLWTPVLRSRLGYCDYACHACGQVCPSGAIPPLSLPRKREQVIGLAVIDKDRCLPWAADTPCIVCQEMCPVPDKAIVLEGDRLVTRPDGGKSRIARPKVVASRCIGCGICEYKCPVEGTSAIVIVPTDPDIAGGGAPAVS